MSAAWARRYVGTPHRWHGRDRDGLDCYGLVMLVYEEQYGIRLPDFMAEYEPEPRPHELVPVFVRGAMARAWTRREQHWAWRVHYTLVAIASVSFLGFLAFWNLLTGLPV